MNITSCKDWFGIMQQRILTPLLMGIVTLGMTTSTTAQSKKVQPWPKDRGFNVGQTVPDIPLYDMKGNEVRFSRYLGKQYILYVWASG